MTIIQHRDCGDEQEKKERVFEGWAVFIPPGDGLPVLALFTESEAHRKLAEGMRVLPCRVIVEEEP